MILTFKQIQAIDLQVELQRGQAVINMQDDASDIGFHVDINPVFDHLMVARVKVPGGKTFRVNAIGDVEYGEEIG